MAGGWPCIHCLDPKHIEYMPSRMCGHGQPLSAAHPWQQRRHVSTKRVSVDSLDPENPGNPTKPSIPPSAVAGCVDAGKSTLVAVLTHGTNGSPLLDSGRGTARMTVGALPTLLPGFPLWAGREGALLPRIVRGQGSGGGGWGLHLRQEQTARAQCWLAHGCKGRCLSALARGGG